jgi:hypothetical protein
MEQMVPPLTDKEQLATKLRGRIHQSPITERSPLSR